MLKKLRWRFIRIAMLSLLAVFVLLFIGVQLIGSLRISRSADALLRLIADNGGTLPAYAELDSAQLALSPDLQFTEDTPNETHYFTVSVAPDGPAGAVSLSNVSSLSEDGARACAADALKTGRTRGYRGSYRFLSVPSADGTTLYFLSCRREIASLRAFAGSTLLVALGAYLAVFILVLFLSKNAIRPAIESSTRQKQFITDAGHELKTPLTIITTSADVLAADLGSNEWVENIRRQAARMSKLVSDLVTLAKLDETGRAVHVETFSLSDAAWDVSVSFQAIAEAKGLRYEQEIDDGLQFRGDASSMEQLMNILLDNAVKYTEPNGWIRFRLQRFGKEIVLEVANACRLPDELDLDRLFDRFYRVDPARSSQSGGSGIGLSVARAITEAHGGEIRVTRGEDRRSLFFTVTL